MPYTPPSHHSPPSSAASTASSAAPSPSTSRRHSFNAFQSAPVSTQSAAPGALPRSSSYLTRHRRGLSAVSASPVAPIQPTPQSTSEDLKGMVPVLQALDDRSSVRQSPPPITGERRGMPTGAVISPPESPPTSDDESQQTRGRRVENMSELKQLHAAISQLPQQRRSSSPPAPTDVVLPEPLPSLSPGGMHHSFSTSSLDQFSRISNFVGRSISAGGSGRRVSHMRSATEPSIMTDKASSTTSLTASDEENDLAILAKPQMVRKKSGELVRPALRLGSRRRPSSMPGTPTFSKVVHFDSHLEHVRHFLQVDRPTAVSAGSSPVDNYDSETEYPFYGSGSTSQKHSAPCEWEIVLTKFPIETADRKTLPVRLERVWLSPDQKFLHGSIAVLNMAFGKSVVCRFTLDYWKTTSEIAAEYCAEILPRTAPQGHDRFNFAIKLSDLANLESKTLYFCIRYNVDGKEFWDNNNGRNFQVDFRKKMLSFNGKNGGALPRSSNRRSTAPRPVSMPVSLDDFDANTNKMLFNQSVHEYLGEPDRPSLRLKSSQSALSLPSDNLTGRLSSPSGQAFANRYDFGASLTAAVQAAKDNMASRRDALYMKSGRKFSATPAASSASTTATASGSVAAFMPSVSATAAAATVTNAAAASMTNASSTAAQKVSVAGVNTTDKAETTKLTGPVQDRENRTNLADSGVTGPESIASKSYEEIVSKYCFYVPKPAVPKDASASPPNGPADRAVVPNMPSPASTISLEGSPVQVNHFQLHGHHHHHSQQGTRPRWYDVPSRGSSMSLVHSFSSPPASPPTGGSTGHARRGGAVYSATFSASHHGTGSTTTSGSASPASLESFVGSLSPVTGTLSSDFCYLNDRFPFNNADGHPAQAIKG